MLTLPPTVRVYVSVAPVDMRKSFDGLSIAVTSVLELDPTSGHLFEVPFEERAAIERSLSETNVRRDWYVARDTQMANVWYRGPNGETVAADLVECESMVRSIRFESARPEVE